MIRVPNGCEFFSFRVEGESSWKVPVTTSNDDGDKINLGATWSTTYVQGSTEAIVAFDHTNNPSININLKFHEDLWREYPQAHSYEDTISKLASLVYPNDTNGSIEPPYVTISYNSAIYRGYFTSLNISQTGPLRHSSTTGKTYRVVCTVTGNFVVSKKNSAPTRTSVASSFKTNFQ